MTGTRTQVDRRGAVPVAFGACVPAITGPGCAIQIAARSRSAEIHPQMPPSAAAAITERRKDATPAVSEWEVRFSERPDVRADYVERETLVLAADETSLELALGDTPFRVTILGRGRGRLQRRALISGLTRENWRDRWQRRATAS